MQRCTHPLIQSIIGIVVAVFFLGESKAQENTEWKNRFLAEAPKSWEAYLGFARSLQVSLSATGTLDKDGNRSPAGKFRSEFKNTKGASLRISQKLGPEYKAEAVGTNPSYYFKLKRRSPDSGWIIVDLEFPQNSSTFSDEQRKREESDLQQICDCLMLWNLWLPTLIHDPDFKITAIKPQEIDGRPAVRFDFDYPKPDNDYPVKGAIRLKGGWMVLDPEHDWILRDYLVHAGQPQKYFMRKTLRIREGAGHHPILTHSTRQIVGKGVLVGKRAGKAEASFESVVEEQYQVVERSDAPLEEFTLSAFGLPEPPGTQVKGSRLHLWIALAGIVCLGIAVVIRWQIRRMRPAG